MGFYASDINVIHCATSLEYCGVKQTYKTTECVLSVQIQHKHKGYYRIASNNLHFRGIHATMDERHCLKASTCLQVGFVPWMNEWTNEPLWME